MTVRKTYSTRKFTEPAIWLRRLTFGLMSAALAASFFTSDRQISRTVSVSPDGEDYTEVGTLDLRPRAIGATRIWAKASVPTNHWVTYELVLVDRDGEIVTSAMKEAWKESGTWQEDGESGTWSESDLDAGLDFKVSQPETLTLGVSVLDYSTNSGLEVDGAVPIRVEARTGTVYRTPLLWGWIVTALLTAVSGNMVKSSSGRKAIFKTIPDSDVGARGTLGGPRGLVRMHVKIESDENTPTVFRPKLWIRNGDGEDVFVKTYTIVPTNSIGTDSRTTTFDVYFRFLERGSYGFYLEVVPDLSVDRTTLTVFDRARTVGRVEVTDIENASVSYARKASDSEEHGRAGGDSGGAIADDTEMEGG